MFGYQLIALLPLIYAVSCAVNVSMIFALTAQKIKSSRKKEKEKKILKMKMIEPTCNNGK